MGNLAADPALSVELSDLGACEAAVHALRKWGGIHTGVANAGCDAVWNLAAENAVNTAKLEALGVRAVLLATLPSEWRDELLAKVFPSIG